MRNSPLACSNAVPTSKVLIHRLNMTLRCHGDRYFHKILRKKGYCGLYPRINPLWNGTTAKRSRAVARFTYSTNRSKERGRDGSCFSDDNILLLLLSRRPLSLPLSWESASVGRPTATVVYLVGDPTIRRHE